MPAPLATVIFVACIVALLGRVSASGVKHSLGLWIPTVWIGIMLSRPVTYWFSSGAGSDGDLEGYLDGSPIERSVLTLLMVVGLAVLARRRVRWSAVFSEFSLVWLFYAYAVLSVVWSPYPLVTFKRFVRELGNVVMILIILTDADRLDALKRVFLRCAAVLIPLSVLFIKYYPAIGRYTHRWNYQTMYSGVTTNKNSLGVLAMVSGLFLVWQIADLRKGPTRWQRLVSVWPEACLLAACAWILSIANSATSLVCFIAGLALFIVGRTWMLGVGARAATGVVAATALGGWLALWMADLRGLVAQTVGRSSTLTERTDIWEAVLKLPTNPIVGAGFSSVWLTPEGWALKEQIGGLAHAHNGYLEMYLNGGAVGVALLLAVLFLSAVQAGRHLSTRTIAGAFFFAFVAAALVYNFTEVTFVNGNAIGLLLWFIAMSNPHSAVAPQSAALADRPPARHERSHAQKRASRSRTRMPRSTLSGATHRGRLGPFNSGSH